MWCSASQLWCLRRCGMLHEAAVTCVCAHRDRAACSSRPERFAGFRQRFLPEVDEMSGVLFISLHKNWSARAAVAQAAAPTMNGLKRPRQ